MEVRKNTFAPGTGGVVAAVALLPIAGFFTIGTSAAIPMGANIKGFIDGDVPLALEATAVAPIVVSTPAPTMAVPASIAAPR